MLAPDAAREAYEAAAHECENGPEGDEPSEATLVTNCWLYTVNTFAPEVARELALSERADLIDVCFPPELA